MELRGWRFVAAAEPTADGMFCKAVRIVLSRCSLLMSHSNIAVTVASLVQFASKVIFFGRAEIDADGKIRVRHGTIR